MLRPFAERNRRPYSYKQDDPMGPNLDMLFIDDGDLSTFVSGVFRFATHGDGSESAELEERKSHT